MRLFPEMFFLELHTRLKLGPEMDTRYGDWRSEVRRLPGLETVRSPSTHTQLDVRLADSTQRRERGL